MQIEKTLHEEVSWRLKTLRPDCLVLPVPNQFWIPTRTAAERELVDRLVARMKDDRQLVPGISDLLVLWSTGSGAIELKRPASRNLFGRVPAGRPSPAQKDFRQDCLAHGVPHIYAESWEDVRGALAAWGRLR